MIESTASVTMPERLAAAVRDFQQQQTGHRPRAVTAGLSGETLIITMHDALSPAELALAQSPAGAAQVQEYHRQLFAASAAGLWREIQRNIGVGVREAALEIETAPGAIVHAFASGTIVQVFQLSGRISQELWFGGAATSCSSPGNSSYPLGRIEPVNLRETSLTEDFH
jgi:uncharacterized protein YbcI